MTDRILSSAWWCAVMLMICTAAALGLFVGYRGVFDVLAGRYTGGGMSLAISLIAAVAAVELCRHRNDLL